jgi:hypothetical protein
VAALIFSVVLLLAWSLVGLAVLGALDPGHRGVQRALISPAVGLSVLLLPTFVLSRVGLPVGEFALGLWAVTLALSVVRLALRRPPWPWRALLAPVAILMVAAGLVGWPMARFGFDWISFANDDMANYALAAQRFLQHGYRDLPDLATYLSGQNYSLAYWYMHVAAGARPGPELMLASLWGATGLNAHQIFMPTIVALHLALVAATGGLVASLPGLRRRRLGVILAMACIAVSPLTSLGALYQLIAQVGGLALTMAALALLCEPSRRHWRREIGSHLAVALLVGALMLWYPEVLPFLVLSWFCWLALTAWKARATGQPGFTRERVRAIAASLALLVLAFGSYLPTLLRFMQIQARQGLVVTDASATYFPFYMVPHGFAYFWGLLPLGFAAQEPRLSMAIVAGMALAVWLLACAWRQARLGVPAAVMTLVMTAVGLVLFYRGNDFGLYKLAMFMQPVVAATVAIAFIRAPMRWGRGLALGLLLLAQTPAQYAYVERSTGDRLGTLTELPQGSGDALARRFDHFMRSLPPDSGPGYYADTSNVVLAKIQSLYAQGTRVTFPSKDFYWPSNRMGEFARANGYEAFWLASRQARTETYVSREFPLVGGGVNRFELPQGAARLTGKTLLANGSAFGAFNRFGKDGTDPPFQIMKEPRNHLIFINSSRGVHYYQPQQRGTEVAFYQLEEDPLFPGREMAGIGRHLLFMVAGPTPGPQLMVEISGTVLRQNGAALPDLTVHGRTRVAAGLVGRGSGRVLTPPVEPVVIDGQAFIHLDMGREGRQFPLPPTGPVTGLYGRQVALDNRYLTAFVRNISLLSLAQVQALEPPHAVSSFPADLAHEGLQYSGIYEDGWISERAFFILQPRAPRDVLEVRGMVPMIDRADFKTSLTVSVDGRPVSRAALGLGDFALKIPLPPGQRSRRIDLAFDQTQTLPGGDGRPTGGLIRSIGFVKE